MNDLRREIDAVAKKWDRHTTMSKSNAKPSWFTWEWLATTLFLTTAATVLLILLSSIIIEGMELATQ